MPDLEAMWQECSSALHQFILKRVSDQAVAEDILQEVFLKIQSHIATLHDVRKFRPWLYQISRNAIIDYYRSKRPTVELPQTLKSQDDPKAHEIIDDLTLCVKSMVDRLPPKYRQAVMLTTYQGLTQKEMAQELGLSLSGAKSRVQRAREKLKRLLLECCSFEQDRLGKVISYEPKKPSPDRDGSEY